MNVYHLSPTADLHEAGRLHGIAAKRQIREFLKTASVSSLLRFANSRDGNPLLVSLRAATVAYAPSLEMEIEEIAEGADVELLSIWIVTLLSEMLHAQTTAAESKIDSVGHCSDVVVQFGDGGIVLGHNEDWSVDWAPLMYWVVYHAAEGASFTPFGGLVYPGQAPGFAVTFTPDVWTSQNGLFPSTLSPNGVGIVAVVRNALQKGADGVTVANGIAVTGQALGMSVQVVEIGSGPTFAATVEVAGAEGQAVVTELQEVLFHFNRYDYIHGVETLPPALSEACARHQEVADRMCVPTTHKEVASFLQGCSGPGTMVSMVFTSDGKLDVWHGSHACESGPDWTTSIAELFRPEMSSFER